MPKRIEFHVLRSADALGAMAPQWIALWQKDQLATPFQRPEWLLPWWRQFGQGPLKTVAILEEGVLVGWLPFYVYRQPASGERQLLPLGMGTSDYLGGVFAPACRAEHIAEALRLLHEESDWDVLYASQLRDGCMLLQAAAAPSFATEHCSRMPAVRMPELPQKIRRNVMYYRNRAVRMGKLELAVADETNCLAAFEALLRLHTERWNARGEPGVLSDPNVLAWHREAMPALQRSGLLRLCTLQLEGRAIAVLYSLIDLPWRPGRTQYFYLTAYSNHDAELRPGSLLLACAMEQAAEEGVRTIDMLRGDEGYKQIWHLERVPTHGFRIFAKARARTGLLESAA